MIDCNHDFFNCSITFISSTFLAYIYLIKLGGSRGVMGIVTGYGHGDTSSIPGQD